VRLSCTDSRWAWLGVAWHLCLLAPFGSPEPWRSPMFGFSYALLISPATVGSEEPLPRSRTDVLKENAPTRSAATGGRQSPLVYAELADQALHIRSSARTHAE